MIVTLIILILFSPFFSPSKVLADICDSGCSPLIDMKSGNYYGEAGGLYGNYSNIPPSAHASKLLEKRNAITPLNSAGFADPNGKIVIMTNGMSNTRIKSDALIPKANADGQKSSKVVIVNGARGSITAARWASNYQDQWGTYIPSQLSKAGVTEKQVQVIWMLHANFAEHGACANCLAANGEYVNSLVSDQKAIINQIKNQFPNIKIIFISSRTYGGYATVDLNDEPFAYESAFAVRRVILDQVNGTDPSLAYGPNMPVLAWGPYLWSDDGTPNSEGLAWFSSDFKAIDGTHPKDPGEESIGPDQGGNKAANRILTFFKSNTYAACWFTGASCGGVIPTNPPPPTDGPTATKTPTPPIGGKPGDANGDNKVDGLDYVIWLNNYNQNKTGPSFGDFNNSGKVDGLDYVIWLSNYGGGGGIINSPTPKTNTPTPVVNPTVPSGTGKNLLVNPGFADTSGITCPPYGSTQAPGWSDLYFAMGPGVTDTFPQNQPWPACAARTKGELHESGPVSGEGSIPEGQTGKLWQTVAVPAYSHIIWKDARMEHEDGTVTHRLYGCTNNSGTNCTLIGQTTTTIPQVINKNNCDAHIQTMTFTAGGGVSSVTYAEPAGCNLNILPSPTNFALSTFGQYPYLKIEVEVDPLPNGEGASGYKAGWWSLEVK